jgi:anaerobic magnesium-protoporphyrin IX monomethyl ester cyclase
LELEGRAAVATEFNMVAGAGRSMTRLDDGGAEIQSVVALVGAEYEENLSLRYLAAALGPAGFRTEIVPFNDPMGPADVADLVLALEPLVVGLSVPFQSRARDLLAVATELRSRGYRGHVSVGGHFATFEYEKLLRDFPAVDSVVRHEGEETFRELCEAVRDGQGPGPVPGLVVRGPGGPVAGPKRLTPGLDELAWPDRRGEPHAVLGVPTAPIIGSRGCYADCSFCCIYAYAESARGPRYRRRSPEEIAREMKHEREGRGVRLFVFHDDNFFLPHLPTNLARYARLAECLHDEGLHDVALVIKCRPNDVDRGLFRLLKRMGVIRAYVGIETNSGEGIVSLNRRITAADNRRALRVLEELDVYCSFNVLIFDPAATLGGVEANLDFMEEMADRPFNFCRAEVYAGTPLRDMLEAQGRLRGDYFAWDYQMRDPRVELLFRIAMTAFASRNFKADGVHNLNMGIRFDNEVMRFFHPRAWDPPWHAGVRQLSHEIGRQSVRLMRSALAFVRSTDPWDHVAAKAFALSLAREVAWADIEFVRRIKSIRREMERRVVACGGARVCQGPHESLLPWAAESARLGTSIGRGSSTELLPRPAPL